MKTLFSFLTIALIFTASFFPAKTLYSQTDTNRVVLEYCTGTWCGYCPCGHTIISNNIMTSYPKTIVIAYHGGSSSPTDPWISYSSAIRTLMGLSSYPTGVVGRMTGIISRSAWAQQVSYQSTLAPQARITFTNGTYNPTTRQVNGTLNVTALTEQTNPCFYYLVLTEDNLISPQLYYADCGPAGIVNEYRHDHVTKMLINGAAGTQFTTGTWAQNQTFQIPVSFTVPSNVVYTNATLNMIVFRNDGSNYTNQKPILQGNTIGIGSLQTTGISGNETNLNSFELNQNYPNPFNPTTSISFNIPKNSHVNLKIYDVLGNEVSNYFNEFMQAGTYNLVFDGSNLSSGIYYYRLTAGDFSSTKKMMLIK